MNTPSPLIRQGITPFRGKSTFYFKVLLISTVHVVVIGGMLLQGCKSTSTTDASFVSPKPDPTLPAIAANPDQTLPPATKTSFSSTGANQPRPAPQPPQAKQAPKAPLPSAPMLRLSAVAPIAPPAIAETKEYVIVPGDTLSAIAHRSGIAFKALMAANPKINPKKLHAGQKVQIPYSKSAVASTASSAAKAPDAAAASGDTTIYTVKSGDTLGQIARLHHTSSKKIKALNDLKTTSIKVGQKLKMPAAKEA